jgi:hypothetical protein
MELGRDGVAISRPDMPFLEAQYGLPYQALKNRKKPIRNPFDK